MFTEERALWLYERYDWLAENLPSLDSKGRKELILHIK